MTATFPIGFEDIVGRVAASLSSSRPGRGPDEAPNCLCGPEMLQTTVNIRAEKEACPKYMYIIQVYIATVT